MNPHRSALFPATLVACLDAGAATASQSLLDDLLAQTPELSIALTNLAQNLGRIDASVAVTTERHFTAMADVLTGYAAGRESYGNTLAVGAGAMVSDLNGALPEQVLAPLLLDLGAISTTGLGALQAADLTGAHDGSGLAQRVTVSAGGVALAAESRGSLGGLMAMQNVALNAGAVEASVALVLADVGARSGGIATTAIGALQNGALNTSVELTATVQANMGDLAETSAALMLALVGGP